MFSFFRSKRQPVVPPTTSDWPQRQISDWRSDAQAELDDTIYHYGLQIYRCMIVYARKGDLNILSVRGSDGVFPDVKAIPDVLVHCRLSDVPGFAEAMRELEALFLDARYEEIFRRRTVQKLADSVAATLEQKMRMAASPATNT